jgi:uncharacterized protein
MALLVTNIVWESESADPTKLIADRLGVKASDIVAWQLLKRSVDGRRRPPVWLANYKVELSVDERLLLELSLHGVRQYTERDELRYAEYEPEKVDRAEWPNECRAIVVGAGPAGLFAALRLAEVGARVVLLERGGSVDERHHHVRRFWRHKELKAESNVVFGEGGAGAFSDGKIYTRRRDGELGWIFRRLVEFGADPKILEEGWAHLGTDKIREIIPRLREKIIELGGDVRFNSTVRSLVVKGGRCVGVRLADGEELSGSSVFMATGHSARDSWEAMLDAGATATQRPIHIGVRVEHPQSVIDRARYGSDSSDLPPASYRLTSKPPKRLDVRPAHTFCMCPGGTVVAATNHEGRVVVNGMSYSKRKAFYANSAIVVEVRTSDYDGDDPLAGVRYQDQIEQAAFKAGGGGFAAPAQRVQDFLADRVSKDLPKVSYPLAVTPVDLREVLPPLIVKGIVEALKHFGKKIEGFDGGEGVLIAPETRTTAPLRFDRDRNSFESLSLPGMLPVGEGAGFAGGIASAALDGLRAASAIIERRCPRV